MKSLSSNDTLQLQQIERSHTRYLSAERSSVDVMMPYSLDPIPVTAKNPPPERLALRVHLKRATNGRDVGALQPPSSKSRAFVMETNA
jgi:hypothetical protein